MDWLTREVAAQVAGYIAKKINDKNTYSSCCKHHLIGNKSDDNDDHKYIKILSRGGLTIPSPNLTEYVCNAFAILDICEQTIINSELPERDAAQQTLVRLLATAPDFSCEKHPKPVKQYCNRAIANVFFNNKRKIKTASIRKQDVTEFKRPKRSKKGAKK